MRSWEKRQLRMQVDWSLRGRQKTRASQQPADPCNRCSVTDFRTTPQEFVLSSHWCHLEALIAAFCRLDKSLSCCWKKGWLVGRWGSNLHPLTSKSHLRKALPATLQTNCKAIYASSLPGGLNRSNSHAAAVSLTLRPEFRLHRKTA